MFILEVGKLYNPSHCLWKEGAQYNYRGGMHELCLFLSAPTRHEVEAVRKGECEFGLYVEPPVILVCYRFGTAGKAFIPWSDATFDFHKLRAARPAEAQLPSSSPELHALLSVVLVDAEDGIVRALRQVTYSPEFTRAIHQAIWDQAHAPAGGKQFEVIHQQIYQQFPTSDALAAACQVRTKGGA